MNEVQLKMFELLNELTSLCDENGISYSLNNKLLFDVINNKNITGNYHDFSIIIKSEDIEKLEKLIETKENRSLESLKNNKNFPGLFFRYVANDTLYFPINKYNVYKNMGFSIDIHTLRYLPKKKLANKINYILETGIEVINGRTLRGGMKAKIYAVFVFMLGIIGKKNRAKLMYNRIYKKDNLNKKYLCYKPLLKNFEKYDSKIFESIESITLNGKSFKYINDEQFLKKRLHDYNINSLNNTYGANYIIDKDISYTDYFDECKEKGFNFRKYMFKRLVLGLKNRKIKKYRKYVNHCWDLMYRTRDRFELYEYYKPLKEEIVRLHKDKNYDELENILKKYTDLLKHYHSKNLCLVFDPVIFDITKDLLVKQGFKDYVLELEDMCPEEHLLPLDNIL